MSQDRDQHDPVLSCAEALIMSCIVTSPLHQCLCAIQLLSRGKNALSTEMTAAMQADAPICKPPRPLVHAARQIW